MLRLRRTRRRGLNRLLSQKVRLVNLKQLVTAARRTQMMLKSLSKIGTARTESVIEDFKIEFGFKEPSGKMKGVKHDINAPLELGRPSRLGEASMLRQQVTWLYLEEIGEAR